VMESRDLVSVSRRVSRPVVWSLGLEGLRSRSRSRRISVSVSSSSSRDFALFFMKFCKEFLENGFKK